MGFLTNLFQTNSEKYLLSAIEELKQEKSYLQQQVKEKDELINEMINKIITGDIKDNKESSPIINLTPLETKILDAYESSKPITLKQLSKQLNIKYSSLKVYTSNMRRKGCSLTFSN